MALPKLQRSQFGDLYGSAMLPVLEEIFASNLKNVPRVRDQIFKSVMHDRDIWQYSEVHDLPLFSSISEGADYSFERQKQGYDKTFTMVKYGLGFSISEEAVDDGKFNFISDAIAKLAKSARETQEQSAMDVLNNGFGSETTADGSAIFATNHPTPSGSVTIANKPATDADLSFSSLSDALSAFKKAFKGDSGIIQNIQAKTLLVPTELGLYARQLVSSAYKADTDHNNINPFHNSLMVLESPHLTDADAWFLLADKSENGLRMIIRKGIETKAATPESVGFLNDNILYKARFREDVGAVHPQGLYGTTGA
jgi:phage major head subunit gpT-like protein